MTEAVEQSDVVITMVTNADAIMSIATEQGLLTALPPGAVWAQMSTIGLEGTEQMVTMMQSRRPDAYFVDAPVSGSKVPAEQGRLLIFASGPDEARSRVTPVFDVIGQRTLWLGPAGRGSRMKLVNNVLLAFTAEGVANSFALAHRLGLETASVIDVFDGGPLVSPWESGKFRRIARGDYSEEFALALALKDVHLALSEAGSDRFATLAALATNGAPSWIKGSAMKTSPLSLEHSPNRIAGSATADPPSPPGSAVRRPPAQRPPRRGVANCYPPPFATVPGTRGAAPLREVLT